MFPARRSFIISMSQWEAMKSGGDPAAATESKPAKEPRRNRIRRDESWDSDGDAQPHSHTAANSVSTQLKKLEIVNEELDDAEAEADWEEEEEEQYYED